MLASPVPIQTTLLAEGAIATSPIDVDGPCSKTGRHAVASLSVFQSPPDAVAT